jgi:hypothetical protein
MDRLPPRIVRRLVLAPLALLICAFFVATAPITLLAAFVADLFLPGNWRTVRLLAFVLYYMAAEIAAMVAMFVLWIASGFGLFIRTPRFQRAHYAFMRTWLIAINGAAKVLFHLKVQIEDRPVPRAGPILVFCRHAGPGNSLLLIGTIMVGYRRHPRIVMLAKLQWEPLFDIMLNRLPNRFITHDPKRRDLYLDAIGDLASGLGDADAFVLFPEGKDFTPRVRQRAIEYLRRKGHDRAADRAERMEHVLPPRHNGVMSAMGAAPTADAVLVAHSVLEDVGTFKELWSRIPLAHPVVARYWRISPSDAPQGEEAVIEWLYSWWETIDRWIADRERAALGGVAKN